MLHYVHLSAANFVRLSVGAGQVGKQLPVAAENDTDESNKTKCKVVKAKQCVKICRYVGLPLLCQ